MSPTEAMWKNAPDRLQKARSQARMARNRKDFLSAHSIMLSAYITVLGGKPVERHHSVKFTLWALWHSWCMFRHRNELTHNQLDVWFQFMLKLRSKLHFKTGRPLYIRWYPQFDLLLLDGAKRAIQLALRDGAKPHQLALAHMTYAEVTYAVNYMRGTIDQHINEALGLESSIRAEPDQPQGLRQLVRIFRKAGELRQLMDDEYLSQKYLHTALILAKGEADAPDQVEKIQALIAKSQ